MTGALPAHPRNTITENTPDKKFKEGNMQHNPYFGYGGCKGFLFPNWDPKLLKINIGEFIIQYP